MKIKIHALCSVKSAVSVVLLLFSHSTVGLVRTSRTHLLLSALALSGGLLRPHTLRRHARKRINTHTYSLTLAYMCVRIYAHKACI